MIQPADFGYNEETGSDNAFMQRCSRTGWLDEFVRYKEILQSFGVEVTHWIHPDPRAKDCIFANNWFTTLAPPDVNVKTLILCPMKHSTRRLEKREEFISVLSQEYPNIIDLSYFESENKFLEGTGSMAIDRKNHQIFLSLSDRSSEAVLNALISAINAISSHVWKGVTFRSFDESNFPIYHTNVVLSFTPLTAIINISSIEEESREKVISSLTGYNICEISHSDTKKFAGNVEVLFSPKHNEEIAFVSKKAEGILNFDCRIEYVDIGDIEDIGGGSTQCMLGKLF